jgi:hypothetical protein
MIAEESDCFDYRYPFATDHARLAYFRQSEPNLHSVPHNDFSCAVTIMCGLPDSGNRDPGRLRNLRFVAGPGWHLVLFESCDPVGVWSLGAAGAVVLFDGSSALLVKQSNASIYCRDLHDAGLGVASAYHSDRCNLHLILHDGVLRLGTTIAFM